MIRSEMLVWFDKWIGLSRGCTEERVCDVADIVESDCEPGGPEEAEVANIGLERFMVYDGLVL